jgi:hypothetical protein
MSTHELRLRIQKMVVAELRVELQRRRLRSDGRKDDLLQRLEEALDAEEEAAAAAPAAAAKKKAASVKAQTQAKAKAAAKAAAKATAAKVLAEANAEANAEAEAEAAAEAATNHAEGVVDLVDSEEDDVVDVDSSDIDVGSSDDETAPVQEEDMDEETGPVRTSRVGGKRKAAHAGAASPANPKKLAQASAGSAAVAATSKKIPKKSPKKSPKKDPKSDSDSDSDSDDDLFAHPWKTKEQLAKEAADRRAVKHEKEPTSFDDALNLHYDLTDATGGPRVSSESAADTAAAFGADLSGDSVDFCRALYEAAEAVSQSLPEMDTPAYFHTSFSLMTHQKQALAWMVSREETAKAPVGGILADEMGLGKTAMTLAVVVRDLEEQVSKYHMSVKSSECHASKLVDSDTCPRPTTQERIGERGKHGPTLIVCPTSVLENWENEIGDRFPPAFRCA